MSQNKQFSLSDFRYSYQTAPNIVSGTADQIIKWLQDWKVKNNNVNKKFEGKVIQFVYDKDGFTKETKTIKLESVGDGYLKGYDLSLPMSDNFRTYREDRISGSIVSLN